MTRVADKIQKHAELVLASRNNPEARTKAREMGIAVGKQIRYRGLETEDPSRYGVVRSLHMRSVVVELTAAGLFEGGENSVVREDEIPYASVLEVLGDGKLSERSADITTSKTPVAPPRKKGYAKCDFCDGAIYEVITTNRGIKALCRNHAVVSDNEKENPTFKFGLGLIHQTFRAWPRAEGVAPVVPAVEQKPPEEGTSEKCQCGGNFKHRGRHRKTDVAPAAPAAEQKPEDGSSEKCWCGGKFKHRGRHRKKLQPNSG